MGVNGREKCSTDGGNRDLQLCLLLSEPKQGIFDVAFFLWVGGLGVSGCYYCWKTILGD